MDAAPTKLRGEPDQTTGPRTQREHVEALARRGFRGDPRLEAIARAAARVLTEPRSPRRCV